MPTTEIFYYSLPGTHMITMGGKRVGGDAGLIWKTAFVLVGSVVGAGFASGQEILQFFTIYGYYGSLGIGLMTTGFAAFSIVTLHLANRLGTTSYKELSHSIFGRRWAGIIDNLTSLTLLGGLGAMLSGSGAVFHEHLHLPSWLGIAWTAVLVWLTLSREITGFFAANSFLVPAKALFVLLLTTQAITWQRLAANHAGSHAAPGHIPWWAATMLFIAYNMITVVAVLATFGHHVRLKTAFYGVALGSLILGGLALVIHLANLSYFPALRSYQVPILYIASNIGPGWRALGSILIWLAIFTTALANTHALASRWQFPHRRSYTAMTTLVLGLALPTGFLPFDHWVAHIYPLFGYLGFVLLLGIAVAEMKKFRG